MLVSLSSSAFAISQKASGHAFSLPSSTSMFNASLKSSKGTLSFVRWRYPKRNVGNGAVISASKGDNHSLALDIVFEPFQELKKELLLLPDNTQASLARQKYTDQCEAILNEQIKLVLH